MCWLPTILPGKFYLLALRITRLSFVGIRMEMAKVAGAQMPRQLAEMGRPSFKLDSVKMTAIDATPLELPAQVSLLHRDSDQPAPYSG
jgi:hypothetical protein